MPDILECKSVSNKSTLSNNSPTRKSELKELYREVGRKSGLNHKTPESLILGGPTQKEEMKDYEQRITALKRHAALRAVQFDQSGISQILSPKSSFLYRGSSARRTVASMLNAKDVTDPALIFTLITSPPIRFEGETF